MSIEAILLIVLGLAFSVIIILWVEGIDYMNKNHPDYKGEDFLDWGDDDVTKMAGRDGWDDDKVHTEGEF